MILGPKKLLQLVRTKKLVTNLTKRELTNPEGAGFDLRLGEIYKISGKSYLGIDERHTAKIKLVKKYDKRKKNKITIKPGEFYLTKTIEDINLPDNLTASITPRSTLYRSGLFLRTGNVAPGYKGGLTFGLKNEGKVPVTFEMGARFAHIQFHEVKGRGHKYRGQWQGGRVTAKRRERQV